MSIWRRPKPLPAVEVPTPRTEVPMEGPTEGELAREKAETALDEAVQRTAEVRAQTPAYESLGERLGALRKRNHLREDIYRSIVGSA